MGCTISKPVTHKPRAHQTDYSIQNTTRNLFKPSQPHGSQPTTTGYVITRDRLNQIRKALQAPTTNSNGATEQHSHYSAAAPPAASIQRNPLTDKTADDGNPRNFVELENYLRHGIDDISMCEEDAFSEIQKQHKKQALRIMRQDANKEQMQRARQWQSLGATMVAAGINVMEQSVEPQVTIDSFEFGFRNIRGRIDASGSSATKAVVSPTEEEEGIRLFHAHASRRIESRRAPSPSYNSEDEIPTTHAREDGSDFTFSPTKFKPQESLPIIEFLGTIPEPSHE